MLTLAVAGMSLFGSTFMPTDDVWVYPHASDPGGDTFLRIWGVDGDSVPSSAADADSFSMAYLKFDVSSFPKEQEIKSAKLVVHQVAPAGYGLGDAKAAPIEARLISSDFSEKQWSPDVLEKVLPKQDGLLGTGSPDSIDGATITISIDLMRDPSALKTAIAEGTLAVALTSSIDAAALGRSAIYKIYSREEKDGDLVPKLILE